MDTVTPWLRCDDDAPEMAVLYQASPRLVPQIVPLRYESRMSRPARRHERRLRFRL